MTSVMAARIVPALFLMLLVTISALPLDVHARDTQADAQCTAGGVVGQPCSDNTNGYTTSGHCTHINVCAADKWPKAPRGCQPGMVAGRDCPFGKNSPAFNTGAPVGAKATTVPQWSVSELNSDAFNAAFADGEVFDEVASSSEPAIIGSASIDGIEYLITADEALEIGEPLSPAPLPGEYDQTLQLVPPTQRDGDQALSDPDQFGGLHIGGSFSGANDYSPQSFSDNLSSILHAMTTPFGGYQATSSFDDGRYNVAHQSLFEIVVTFLKNTTRMFFESLQTR